GSRIPKEERTVRGERIVRTGAGKCLTVRSKRQGGPRTRIAFILVQELTCGNIPLVNGLAVAAGCDAVTIGGKRNNMGFRRDQETLPLDASFGLPEADRAVFTGGGDQPPIGGHRGTSDRTLMALRKFLLLARSGIPYSDHVPASRSQESVIRREGQR